MAVNIVVIRVAGVGLQSSALHSAAQTREKSIDGTACMQLQALKRLTICVVIQCALPIKLGFHV